MSCSLTKTLQRQGTSCLSRRAQPVASRRAVYPRRRCCQVLATSAPPAEQSAIAKFSASIGLPTDEGTFGFTPFSEMVCGRLAMIGFVSSIVAECVTGKGTLGQVGITPSSPVLIGLLVLLAVSVTGSTAWTANRLIKKDMSRREIDRYRNFLGLLGEEDAKKEAMAMKRRGDALTTGVTPSGPTQAALRARVESAAAASASDAPVASTWMATSTAEPSTAAPASPDLPAAAAAVAAAATAAAAAAATAAATAAANTKTMEDLMFYNDEAKYARGVEVSNGRWAMVGILSAILVEAGTGKGIVLQIIMYLKWSGLLGPLSGF